MLYRWVHIPVYDIYFLTPINRVLGLVGLGLTDLETTDNKTRRNTVALGKAWKRPRQMV